MDPDFPIREWDHLLTQAEITINLLRSARTNPKLSACHLKPDDRPSWSPNGEEGWVIGPSLDHYRCLKCYFPTTRSEQNCDTLTFIPTVIPFPKVTLEDHLHQATEDIIKLLTYPPSTTTPSLEAGNSTQNALLKISQTLNRADDLPKQLPPLPRVETTQASTNKESKQVESPDKTMAAPLPRVQSKSFRNTPSTPITKTKQYRNDAIKHHTWNSKDLQPTQSRYPLRNSFCNYRAQAAQYLLAQHLFSSASSFHLYDNTGKKLSVDNLITSKDAIKRWLPALSNEWGRLAQSNDAGVEYTNTIEFIHHKDVPKNKKSNISNLYM